MRVKYVFLLFILIFFMAASSALTYRGAAESVRRASCGARDGGLFSVSSAAAVSDARNKINLPILMYHGITDESSSVSEYVILDKTFENDLKWLGKNGFTTITVKQLADYAEKGSALPDKPVLLTFDDGYANNYTFAFPLLQKYHMHAVISVIGNEVDTSSGDIYRKLSNSSLSWGEIAILASSENVEIGNHTYSLHTASKERKGADKSEGESQEEYERLLKKDLSALQKKISDAAGSAPLLFAWPYGEYPKDGSADKILKEAGLKASVTSYQKMNVIEKGNPDSLFGLKRFLRTPDFDMNKIIC